MRGEVASAGHGEFSAVRNFSSDGLRLRESCVCYLIVSPRAPRSAPARRHNRSHVRSSKTVLKNSPQKQRSRGARMQGEVASADLGKFSTIRNSSSDNLRLRESCVRRLYFARIDALALQ